MPGHRILIVLESPKERMAFARYFEERGFLVDTTPEGEEVFSVFEQNRPILTIADIATPGFSASDFITKSIETDASCRTVILSSEPVVEHAINLMKLGALDYLVRPIEPEQLELCARQALSMRRQAEPADTSSAPSPTKKTTRIITQDKGMQKLLTLMDKVADSSAAVLIQGESGTGKELFAKYLHEKSGRADKPFIAVNCAALPENLLESELFGHEKGAFTGAISRKIGKFEMAHKGTLFLDEITEMQIHLQAKLLRVLQEKIVDRVGGTEPVKVDVRVIATTNRDAGEAVDNGDFRQDLFYRLNTIPMVLPPLRQRKGDLELLCRFFIKKYSKIDGRDVKGLTSDSFTILKSHGFPGNVRELENIIHRAVLLADAHEIEVADLMIESSAHSPAQSAETSGGEAIDATAVVPGSLREMEEQMIYRTLDETEGNRTHAAKILGISVRTLRNKLNEYKEKA